ncbi:TlpA family protein disulfide reductase [Halobacillus sp. A1]|uniref:TlpA family protein disulfide reductase n=1 Tax=Halobacillus sp. A1 TaxID=2880262 RepID=UPI0020A6CFB0|nr:TlpA disulfide reductase family protein [Halobacillus sp. A1]MCP3032815.1 TlpA family protein disulfide reductase [Halobacillus sp. A1]
MRKAPGFQLPYIQSEELYHLKQDLGKVVILTFWTSWCPDCGVDLPKKEQLYRTMDNQKVSMLTINVTGRERNEEDAKQYVEKFLKQPTLSDSGVETYNLYKAQGVPSTIIINQEGNIAYQFGDQASFMEIVQAIGELI